MLNHLMRAQPVSRQRLLSFAVASIVMLVCSQSKGSAGSSTPTKGQTVWMVTQKLQGAGERVTYITDGAVKVTSPVGGWSMVTKAPEWEVTAYNSGSKTWFKSAREKYLSSFIGRANMVSSMLTPEGGAWKKTNTRSKILGVDAVLYEYVNIQRPNQPSTYKCWMAEKIPFSKSANEITYKFMGAPDTNMLPLQMIASSLKAIQIDKKATILETKEVKRMPMQADLFKIPTGYRLANSAVEVMIGLDGNGFMNDFTGMFDEPAKSQRK